MKLLAFLLVFMLAIPATAQLQRSISAAAVTGDFANTQIVVESAADTPEIIVEEYPDTQPEFPGDIRAYLANNLSYPERLWKSGAPDRIVFRFIVDADGQVVSATLKKSSTDPVWDSSMIAMLLAMPRWKPATKGGKPVPVAFSLPMHITIE